MLSSAFSHGSSCVAFCIEVSEGSLAILAVEGISQGDFLFANGSETTVETHLCTVGELVKNKRSETICETGLSGGAPPGLSSVGISQGDCFSDNGAEMSTGSHSCTEEGVDGVWFSPSNKIFSTGSLWGMIFKLFIMWSGFKMVIVVIIKSSPVSVILI